MVYASPTSAPPSAAAIARLRRKPVPRLTRLPIAMTALLAAALASATCSCGGAVDSMAGWFSGSAEMKVAPSSGGGRARRALAFALR